eukprot:12157787-Heterocapsa_arctica.AAC.1
MLRRYGPGRPESQGAAGQRLCFSGLLHGVVLRELECAVLTPKGVCRVEGRLACKERRFCKFSQEDVPEVADVWACAAFDGASQ